MMQKGKKIAAIVLAAAMAFTGLPANVAYADDATVSMSGNQTVDSNDIVVLYTNDVHNGYEHTVTTDSTTGAVTGVSCLGYSSVAWFKNNGATGAAAVELVDNGDAIQGGVIGALSKGEDIVDIMNEIGYTIAVPGNHEFDFGMNQFLSIAGKASFEDGAADHTTADYEYICSNFTDADGNTVFDGYTIKEYTVGEDTVKVAYVGITTPETYTKSTPTYFQDSEGNYIYSFSENDLYNTIQTSIDAAETEGADYIIAIGHTGTEGVTENWDTQTIISNLTGLDAYIDGHSHSTIESENMTDKDGNEVVVSSTGTKLAALGEMVIDTETGTITTSLVKNITEEDATAKAYIDNITAELATKTATVVAHSDVDLTTTVPDTTTRIVRSQETNLGDLCADAYKDQMEADCAIVNGGGVRANISAGDITYGDIINVHPFGNLACLAEVTGQQILDALEMGARNANIGGTNECGGFLQVSGITYDINTNIPSSVIVDDKSNFISVDGEYRVQNVKINGEAIDLTKTYKLATHNYYLKSYGDGMTMFKGCNITKSEVMVDNEVLINYIKDTLSGTISSSSIYANPYGEGRIRVLAYDCSYNGAIKYTYQLQGASVKNIAIEAQQLTKVAVQPASLTAAGVAVHYVCPVCGEIYTTSSGKTKTTEAKLAIAKIASVTLSASSYTYDGKAKQPTVTVKDANGKALTKDTDYTVEYTNNTNPGTASVTVTFQGNYTGTKTLNYSIKMPKTTVTLSSPKKGQMKVVASKKTGVSGYQVRYATKSSMSGAKSKNFSSSVTLTGLSAGKKYYVQVRTYKKIGSKTYYSDWSTAKSVTIKK